MDLVDVGKLVLIVITPTVVGVTFVNAPRWCAALARLMPRRDPGPEPIGPPIERLAADLRRLLRLHGAMTDSAHLAIRAHRIWAVEAAIGVRAVEAARALDIPHREPQPPDALGRDELAELLHTLGAAGMVLPAKVGPFAGGRRW